MEHESLAGQPILRKSSETESIQIDSSMTLKRLSSRQDFDEVDVVRVTMNGEHGTRTNSKCVKMFYVLSGQIRTTTDGKQYVAQAGDLICIPKGVTAHIEGDDAEALIICGPAFDSAFDV